MNKFGDKLKPTHLLLNKTSMIGLVIGLFGFVTAVSLLVVDFIGGHANPYLGIFTYMVAPAIAMIGLILMITGAVRMRRWLRHHAVAEIHPFPVVDLNNPSHFWTFVVSIIFSLLLLSLSAVGTYRAYHFTESVEFCGELCHSVMEPEHSAFLSSPHANVDCVTCHIGPGADWFVKSKINGLRQVWNTAFDRYPRPIETPVKNLRPAKETCYTCHWPEKFFESVLVERTYYRASEEENDPWSIKMLINVGGGDSRHGRGQGIHWHMAVDNKVEYVAADEKRLEIPWVRQTTADGEEIIYRSTEGGHEELLSSLEDRTGPASEEIRVMDCIDCHNRPAHQYHSPERAMNDSMRAGLIDVMLPSIKMIGCELLDGEYETHEDAFEQIEARLADEFPEGGENVEQAAAQIKRIYRENFFPEMNVSWREYPDHIGHQISPGCMRCHDGKHVSDSGKMIRDDCNICHTVIAQGPGTNLEGISSGGLEFIHPEDVDGEHLEERCDECHEGMPVY